MKLTNGEIERMMHQLSQHLDRIDIIGFAAARNTRIMSDALSEYFAKRDELIIELGEEECDEQGVPTGEIKLEIASDNFSKFVEAMTPYAEATQEIPIMKLKYEQAINLLSGAQLLELDWMFENSEGVS